MPTIQSGGPVQGSIEDNKISQNARALTASLGDIIRQGQRGKQNMAERELMGAQQQEQARLAQALRNDALIEEENRARQQIDELQKQFPNRAIGAGGGRLSVGAPRSGLDGIDPKQFRYEAMNLNKIYESQTKPIKEKQLALQEIEPLLDDPTNIDDQQLRRQLALAVNKGVLSDEDVEDALPGDIKQFLTKAYNWVQPALAPFGAEKKRLYSDQDVKSINKLLTGKLSPLEQQLEEAGAQIRQMAPTVAPTLSTYRPDALEGLLKGITGAREAQQQRLNKGLQGSKQPVKKLYSPSRNQTKIMYSDGSEEIVDGRQ